MSMEDACRYKEVVIKVYGTYLLIAFFPLSVVGNIIILLKDMGSRCWGFE